MTWHVEYTSAARKELRKMGRVNAARILDWMDKHIDGCEDPRVTGKGLTANRSGQWRYRIGDYRVHAYCETRWSPSRSSVSAIAAKPTSNPFVELIQTNPDRSSKRSGFFMPADVPRAGASGGQRTTTVLWTPRAGNQFPDPGRLRRAMEATARRRETDPPLSLRDDPDNGTCPAMPMRGGAGKRSGAWTRRDPFIFFWAVCLRQGS